MKFGEFDVFAVSDGIVWLDGGAMFGVAPKALWSRLVAADERNRVPVGMNCLLVRTPSHTVLIDAGMGRDWPPKKRNIYALDDRVTLLSSLEAMGVRPEDVDLVLLTHLHIDHVGWCVREGRPVFPKAKHIVQKQEWQDAVTPHPVRKGSYLHHQFAALKEAGLLDLIEGDAEILPGLRAAAVGGHTLGYQTFTLDSGGRKLFFLGETIPTQHHIRPAYIMAYDLYPVQVAELKCRIIAEGIRDNWLFFFEHDPELTFARFESDGGGGASVVAVAAH